MILSKKQIEDGEYPTPDVPDEDALVDALCATALHLYDENERLREALAPFVSDAKTITVNFPEEYPVDIRVTSADYRFAREALAHAGVTEEESC